VNTDYHAKYTACELTRKHAASDIGKLTASLQNAQVDLNPHQVEAALFAFKSPLSKGAILADEVGLGKTIEAGIILSQLWAERRRKLLVICPASLRKQWSQELADKFYLPSIILEAKSFTEQKKNGKRNPFDQDAVVICSFQFARSREELLGLVGWDLAIIDEAHRLRNVYKPSNRIGQSIRQSLSATKKVLLTATPLQNSILELYGLVSIIDDYAFGDLKSFKSRYGRMLEEEQYAELKERLSPLCKRTLRRQVSEYVSYTNRLAIVQEFSPYTEEQQLYDLVSGYLQRDRLFALPVSQRQLMTLILRKLLASSTFAIQMTLEGLAAKLDELIIRNTPRRIDDAIAFNFEIFEEIREEWQESPAGELEVPDVLLSPEDLDQARIEREELREFARLAAVIRKNSKGDKLLTALGKGFEKLRELGAAEKAVIFTESTRTQSYLKRILEAQGFAGRIVLFNGSNGDSESREIYREWIARHAGTDRISGSPSADMRQALVERFRSEATIMIATEAAAEGINLQFCSLVVNYDLPWNPQRIEQRIGRCHRYGQRFDVVVVNFLNNANAADQRVYQLLDQKFQLFSGVFGASDEVLGSLEGGIDFEKRIATIYQECRRPEEIQQAFDRLQHELEENISERFETTRRNLLENFDEEVHQKLRFSFEKGREYLDRYEELLWELTRYFLRDHAEFDHSDDSFMLRRNPFPEEEINPGPYRLLRSTQENRKSEIILDDDTNIYRNGHPLARKIIDTCRNKALNVRELKFGYTASPKKISLLDPLVGASGWLQAQLFTIESFEAEEHLLLLGMTDDGVTLDTATCARFFSLEATEGDLCALPYSLHEQFDDMNHGSQQAILDENTKRNSAFCDEEYEKLDKWAEDMKLGLETEIRDLDAEMRLRKAEVRKIGILEEKVRILRLVKELEKKRDEKRRHLFEAQDRIEARKDSLLEEIEARMSQSVRDELLFCVRWIVC
jgi:SNF2 family DNA or RNA helicase